MKSMNFVVLVLLSLVTTVASAQMGNWHDSQLLCEEVYLGGNALEYKPAPNAARAQQRANVAGVTRQPLPQDGCIEMLVADGRYHSVFVPKGTEMLWKGEALYAHPTCGNPVRGEPLWLTHQEVYRRKSVAGRDGRDGDQGSRGERGPPGRSIPAPPQGGVYEGYSGKELARDLGHDLVWGLVTDRITGKITRAWVRREEIRGQTQVQSEYWRSQRGPTHVTQIGNCNAAFGSRTSCVTQSTPGPAGPPGRDGRDGQPGRPGTVPPIYTPPGEPSPGRPPYTPPAEPVFGGGGYAPPANPIYNQPAGPADPIGNPVGNPGYTPPGGPVYNGPSDPVPYTPPGGG